MKATLLTYLAGMGGDFLAFQIHRDPKFFTITNDLIIEGVKVTKQNMWRFPNLLAPIGLEAKVYPRNRPWIFTSEHKRILDEIYGDKQIILPAHWYNRIVPELTNGLFDSAVRLHAKERNVLKISYALWWIKSHAIANLIWPHREEEIVELMQSNHPNKHLMPEVLNNYHNWKYNAVKYDLLKSGKLDINHYIRCHFNRLYAEDNKITHEKGYTIYNIDDIFYGKMADIDLINSQFDVSINKEEVKEYMDTNLELIQECLGFGVYDSKFDNDETYFDAIIDYAKDTINERPNQFDYYNGRRR